jgi:hypothetical protein
VPQVDFTLEDVKNVIDERLEARLQRFKQEFKVEFRAELKEELDQRFVAEREYTRQLVREEVKSEVSQQFDNFVRTEFRSFIDDNFTPAMERLDRRFDRLEDRTDQMAGDVAELRVDTRHLKQAFRTRGFNPANG